MQNAQPIGTHNFDNRTHDHGPIDLSPSRDNYPGAHSDQQEQERHRAKRIIYGKKFAFQLEDSKTTKGFHTVSIETAQRKNPNSTDKSYDWKKKINFQLTFDELPVFCGVLIGVLPSARFDNHGADNSKFLEIINQGSNFFIKMGAKGYSIHIAPITLVEAYQLGLCSLNAYSKNFDDLSSDTVLTVLRMFLKQLMAQGKWKQAQQRNTQ